MVKVSWQEYMVRYVLPRLHMCVEAMSSRKHCNKRKVDVKDCCRQLDHTRSISTWEDQVQMWVLRKRMNMLMWQYDAYWKQRANTH